MLRSLCSRSFGWMQRHFADATVMQLDKGSYRPGVWVSRDCCVNLHAALGSRQLIVSFPFTNNR